VTRYPTILKRKEGIAEAGCIYIFGYGFDQVNNKWLNLSELLNVSRNSKTVMFTNYNNSGIINKISAHLFALHPNELLPEGGRIIPNRNSVAEKSVRDVYEALALDFDSPEERPLDG
jgi:hypothetical protein